jgi:hypothetical protein
MTKINTSIFVNIICILILFIYISCNSENGKKNLVDTSKYYEIVKLAELDILNGDYEKAEILYEKVFDIHQYMFAKDLNNAMRCSAILENWNNVTLYAELLALKGVDFPFYNDAVFENWRATNEGEKFMADYDSLKFEHLKIFNAELTKELNDLSILDQSNYCNIPLEDNYYELKSLLTPNIDNAFSELIKKHGFPSEEKIGVELAENNQNFKMPVYYVLYKHSFQSGDNQLLENINKYTDSLKLDKRLITIIDKELKFVKIPNNDTIYISDYLNYDNKLKSEFKMLKYNIDNKIGFYLNDPGLVTFNFADSISKKQFYLYHIPVGVLKLD